ncbi:hypothetical protein RND71_005492 [Anisodus tanguticus]|uniref:Uncharacterized protein n=1 Tax=Anisodus tanguticus TaxID=243964 RepID=A0AAE1VVJ2_9SOLA|nr:hypothetical protein RND71_005492 [Anisodus tanguticus]
MNKINAILNKCFTSSSYLLSRIQPEQENQEFSNKKSSLERKESENYESISSNNEDTSRSWRKIYCPQCMKLYSDYREIAHGCIIHFNGDQDYESTAYGPEICDDEDPILRLKVISEADTLLAMRKTRMRPPTDSRRIQFTGDAISVSIMTNLPYSPSKMTHWVNKVVTSSQL